MRCIWCKLHDLQYPIIIHYYEDYGNMFSHAETYCSYTCLRKAIV